MNSQLTLGLEKRNSKEDFQQYFLNVDNFNKFAESCIYGEVKNFRCRWTAWRAFLGLIPIGDEEKIRTEVKKQRTYYNEEYDKYMNFRAKVKLSADVDNPLSTCSTNPWNSFYTDSELKDEIKKDIERTYQDLEFFLDTNIQTILTNILFVWSKQNPDPSYRQGMNEIVAVLTYACFIENFKASGPEENIYDFLNDEKYAEADIYTLFKKIMELDQKAMFALPQQVSNKTKQKKKPDASEGPARPNLPVVHRAAYIQEELLPQLQPHLFNHFKTLQVEPHIYMMRWLRCMLAREYKITQTLQLWDSILAYQYKFSPDAKKLIMLDYLCVAMLLNISNLLFDIDNGGMLLGKLLKYPPTDNVKSVIDTCHTEVLNNLNSISSEPNSQLTNPIVEKKSSSSSSALSSLDDRYSPSPAVDKKLVLFNPAMPIFEKKELKSQITPGKKLTTDSSDPLGDPLAGPKKKPTNPKPSNLFSPSPITNKPLPKSVSPSVDQAKQQNESEKEVKKASPKKKEEEQKIQRTEIKRTTYDQKEEDDSKLVLFSQSKPKESPAGADKIHRVSYSFKDAKSTEPLGGVNVQKETNDCIKKVQSAMKLVKLENENNHSLNLEEAIEDLQDVLKILRDKLSKV